MRRGDGLDEEGDRLPPASLDEPRRARIRRRVLRAVDPTGARASDRAYAAVALAASAAPHLVRGLVVLVFAGSLTAAAGLAAADSLPDEPLYPVKLATEQLRLAIAATPEDRATVELTLAEHRLVEAQKLTEAGREDAALEAFSAYGTHLANAAAELAVSDQPAAKTEALIDQLETRIATQKTSATTTANRLASDPRTATAAAVLATVGATAPPNGGGSTAASRIAANAAAFAERAAEAAASFAAANGAAPQATRAGPARTSTPTTRPTPPTTTGRTDGAEAAGAPRPTPTATARPSATPTARTERAAPTVNASAAAKAAQRARAAAEQAKAAAEKARGAARKNAPPIVAPRR